MKRKVVEKCNVSKSLILIIKSNEPEFRKGHKKNPYRINCKGSIDMAVTYSPTLLCSTIGHGGLNCSPVFRTVTFKWDNDFLAITKDRRSVIFS